MPAQTYSANAVARDASKATGRKVDAKRVRSWARANIGRFDDDGYTTHAYSAAERTRIIAALTARAKPDAKGTAGRASSASRGRTKAAKVAKPVATTPEVAS